MSRKLFKFETAFCCRTMVQVLLPEDGDRPLAFYLAMEEYVAWKYPEGDYFFVWRTGPSVIFGRNQDMEAEVNVPYCQDHGIRIYRRKSGGGCVYSDMGNLMHSCITSPGKDAAFVFYRYMQQIALALRRLGLEAEVSGRNDIMVDGRKVSGNAFHLLPKRCIIHGTMLYDTDLDVMTEAITPSAEKLERKGVSSVRQRVGNLKDSLKGIDMEAFSRHIVETMCDGSVSLDGDDVERIREISRGYMVGSFIKGRNPKH